MSYRLDYDPAARRQLRRLPPQAQQWVADAVENLKHNPRPHGCIKLTDSDEWRIHVKRDYRVAYMIDDKQQVVSITKIGPRGGFYKN